MSRLKTWCLALAVLSSVAGCGDDPPATTPPTTDSGTDKPTPTDTPTPEDTTPTDTPVPSDQEPPACDMGQTRCGGVCVDTQSNSANCGTCGTTCAAGQVCRAGSCQADTMCMTGQTLCGTTCVDTTTDGANCGSCGNACAAGQTCNGGMCRAPDCPTGQVRCGSACVDTSSDSANCGTCGNTCAAGQTCMGSMCRSSMMCPTGQTSCGGVCADTMTDAANCGGCGTACTAGQTCQAGTCRAMTCPTGQVLCGSTCVTTATDAANCGMCGRTCAAGQTCAAGVCTGTTMCPTGQTMCASACADLQTDPANCGTCGNACSAAQTCTTGACRTSRPTCAAGQTDCTPMAAAPTCVTTQTDNANCGACGNACPTGSTCRAGACACATGQVLCGRTCVNAQTDATNCGRCGNACPTGQVCTAGACGCATGTILCGGACVNAQTDNANCGTCGTACSGGQTCTAGRCACATGSTLCGTGAAATCVNTATDRANCGMCGRACAMGQTCTAGVCGCPTGQTVCGSGTTAACTNLMTSAANCGRCGNVCPAGIPCMAGVCRGTPPANDTRAGATVINLAAGNAQNLAADTTSARNDTTGTCGVCTAGNDVYFRFVLTQPEIVYADTLGTTWDTSLFIQDASGNNVTAPATTQVTCNDDLNTAPCAIAGNLASQVVARLNPGTYHLVLSGCSAGMATIHFQHLPAGNGATARIAPSGTVQTVAGATTGTGQVTSACCSGGPENSYWWITCPNTAATNFQATSCSATTGANLANYDVEVAQYSALRPAAALSVCNDDVGTAFVCGAGASMGSTLPATTATQAGLNTLIVDSCIGTGNYTVGYVLANCTAGLSRCGASCVDANTTEAHCGGCDRRCAAGQTCVRGACQVVPPGETRDNPIAIDARVTNYATTVNTTGYRNDAMGSCGCTTGRDVFYSFTLAAPSIVYADTIGSAFDTGLFFQDATGTNLTSAGGLTAGTTCNDDGGLLGCATGTASQIMAQLPAGSYLLVVSGCAAGNAAVRFQRVPVGSGTVTALAAGSRVLTGTTTGTAGRVTATCCSDGAEDMYYWYTCPAQRAGTLTASTCGRALWDTELSELSPGRAATAVCNDDVGGTCGNRSTLAAAIPAGPGIHALYVDGCSSGAGAYTASVTRP